MMLAPFLLAFLLPLSSAQVSSIDAADPNLSSCAPAIDKLASCTSAISTFLDLPPSGQASCLCYNQQSSWVPDAYDIPFSACVALASTADPTDYPGLASAAGLCSRVGNVLTAPASGAASTTESPSSTVDTDTAVTTSEGTSTPTLTESQPTTPSAGAGIASTSSPASAKPTSSAGAGTANTPVSTSAKPTASGSGGNSMMQEWSGKGVALLFGIALVGFAAL